MTQTTTWTTPNTYQQALDDFRKSYPLQPVPIQNMDWTVYDTGGTSAPLLILHGGGGQAEALFPQIMLLAQQFRVIAPNIPSQIKTIDQAIDGLSTLLNALDMNKVYLYGISLGGHIAQIFIRRHYARVQDMVLSHTAIPCEHLAQKTAMQYRMLQMYPSKLLSVMFKRATRNNIANFPANLSNHETQFWQQYFDEQYETVITKSTIVSRAAMMSDYFRQFTFHASDLNYWDGRTLIIESSHDEIYEEGDRGALLTMYSRAWMHTFEGYTHLATILAHQQSAELVADFLRGDAYDHI